MFADRIKAVRTSNKLTQREFAERVGISPTTLISYEKGGKVPSYDILVRIAKEFSISLDWLCDVSGSEIPDMPTINTVHTVILNFEGETTQAFAMALAEAIEKAACGTGTSTSGKRK